MWNIIIVIINIIIIIFGAIRYIFIKFSFPC